MKCPKCLKDYDDSIPSCPNCGEKNPAQLEGGGLPQRKSKKAVASLVLGICGILFFELLVCQILAVIFGRKGKREAVATGDRNAEKIAKAGTILGIIGISMFGLAVLVAIAVPVFVSSRTSSALPDCKSNLLTLEAAVSEYEAYNNKLPDSLEDLVPEYLAEVPVCPSCEHYISEITDEYLQSFVGLTCRG